MREGFSPREEQMEGRREAEVRPLVAFLVAQARERGLPVDQEGRLAFSESRGDALRAKEKIARGFGEWADEEDVAAFERRRFESDGNRNEIFTTALFQRLLGDRFVAVRASMHDDVNKGVDTLLIRAEDGEVVCVLDHMQRGDGEPEKLRLTRKVRRAQEKNYRGSSLDDGVRKDGETFLRARQKGLPTFVVSFEKRIVEKGIQDLGRHMRSGSDATEGERVVFLREVIFRSVDRQAHEILGPEAKGGYAPQVRLRTARFLNELGVVLRDWLRLGHIKETTLREETNLLLREWSGMVRKAFADERRSRIPIAQRRGVRRVLIEQQIDNTRGSSGRIMPHHRNKR